MNVLTVPRTIAALEYKALRYPAQLLETKLVVTRLSEDSTIRLTVERVLGKLDSTVGKLLADDTLQQRGRLLQRRADVVERAVVLEVKAAQRKVDAERTLRQNSERAKAEKTRIEEDYKREQARLSLAREDKAAAVERKASERKLADAQAIATKAEALIAVDRNRVDEQEARIEERVATATAAPKAQLKQAVKDTQAAAGQKDDADRLAALAETERDRRKNQ